MSSVLQFTAIWAAGVISFGAQSVSFGMLVASTLAPWGTIQGSRGTSEHKEILGSRLGFLLILRGSGIAFCEFVATV